MGKTETKLLNLKMIFVKHLICFCIIISIHISAGKNLLFWWHILGISYFCIRIFYLFYTFNYQRLGYDSRVCFNNGCNNKEVKCFAPSEEVDCSICGCRIASKIVLQVYAFTLNLSNFRRLFGRQTRFAIKSTKKKHNKKRCKYV